MVYEFADFQLDTAQRQLRRAGVILHLTPKAYQLLLLLVERQPQVLSKSEIQDLLWPDTFVTESTLAALIAEIRKQLGDRARESRFIRTAHGFGYGFCGVAEQKGEPGRAFVPSAFAFVNPAGREYSLRRGDNLVGRDPVAEVRIDDQTVSRRHAVIRVSDEGATLEDLESKNGTMVNGVRISTSTMVGHGDNVSFGGVDLVFRRSLDHTSTLTLQGSEISRRLQDPDDSEQTSSSGDCALIATLVAPEDDRP